MFFTSIATFGRDGTILTDMFTCVAQWFVCFVSFLRRDMSISEEPSLRKPYTCFYWKEPCVTRNYLFPANGTNGTQEWRCWKMMFFFKGMIWRFQPPVFGGVSEEDTQNDAFWSQHQLDEKSILASIPSTFFAGPRPYFEVFNWVVPPVLVIIDQKHHHKSSLAMFSRGLPFNLWNYWHIGRENKQHKQPKLSIFCRIPHGRPTVGWLSRNGLRWKLAHRGVEMFFWGGGGEILGFVVFIVGYLKMFNIGYFNIWGWCLLVGGGNSNIF